ncbi:MAG TPA: class I SAM-dependent methyltransferase [Pseudomonadales bacterium]|nr:class I SAM-dependent methyltransferase [Pseudomonadales bacterium]
MDTGQTQRPFRIETSIEGWHQHTPYALEQSSTRYALWQKQAKAHGFLPVEHLLPRIYCPCPGTPPTFMDKADTITATDRLRQQRDALAPWGFWFKLAQGMNTKKLDILGRNRIICRSHLISATVEKLLGKRLAESTILDMACHSGFFSMDMASRGVKHVTGVELRDISVRQATFLQQHYGIDNITFEQGDIYAWKPTQPFTVVLNLGLLYHVIDPVTLVRRTYDACTDFAVIDTICHPEPTSAFIACFNKDTSLNGEGSHTVELHPTYRALIDTMHDAGFIDLLELVAETGGDNRVSKLYRNRLRRCIIGFKRPMVDVFADNGLAI